MYFAGPIGCFLGVFGSGLFAFTFILVINVEFRVEEKKGVSMDIKRQRFLEKLDYDRTDPKWGKMCLVYIKLKFLEHLKGTHGYGDPGRRVRCSPIPYLRVSKEMVRVVVPEDSIFERAFFTTI